MTPSTAARGRAGEAQAAAIYQAEGWHILARNFRRGPGEIDLIVRKGELVAFVEVKTWRKGARLDLGIAINAWKCRRIIETSKIFLHLHRQYNKATLRYDVFLVETDGSTRRYEAAFNGDT